MTDQNVVYPDVSARNMLGSPSAISWAAIFAGATAALAASLVLLLVAAGLGLLSVAAWPYAGASASTVAAEAAIALIVIQWVSACLGGYITGRLRTRWTGTHTHEVFFRDTAHGFVTWSLATLVAAVMFASAASSGTRATHALVANATANYDSTAQEDASRARSSDSSSANAIAPDAASLSDAASKEAAQGSIFVALSMLVGAFIASASAAIGGRLRDLHP